ncbi:MAG: hypothetical protein MUD14_11430 [Hydrococcus sp. Prado102]|nr:hypothetical protein [Hydrococcus sp. Prado102]
MTTKSMPFNQSLRGNHHEPYLEGEMGRCSNLSRSRSFTTASGASRCNERLLARRSDRN